MILHEKILHFLKAHKYPDRISIFGRIKTTLETEFQFGRFTIMIPVNKNTYLWLYLL